MSKIRELQEKRTQCVNEALALVSSDQATPEDIKRSEELYAEAQTYGNQAAQLELLTDAQKELKNIEAETNRQPAPVAPGGFRNLGDFAYHVHVAGSSKHRFHVDARLHDWQDRSEPASKLYSESAPSGGVDGQWENKALVENVGADGGFLVPTEYRDQLLALDPIAQPIATRAMVIPMRRRALRIPVLDQTNTTAGTPAWFGGMTASWTEEASNKNESTPQFKQMQLVAHKLVCYSISSDELLEDAVISLDTWLQSEMGFAGAIRWYSELAYLQGTGTGQPLGVITAVNQPTLVVAQAAANLSVGDLANMLMAFQGRSPVWHINRQHMANLIQLNGPAANPSYVFIPNAREGVPSTLFGYPIIWEEKLPLPGTQGSILLADWSKYVIGQRQEVTFRSTDIELFRHDQTSFRMVYRVDGQPWMSAPLTYQDGTTQVSPFVILGAVSGS